jgi:hypothetical protein
MAYMLPIPNKKTAPQRMSRKRLRNEVFIKNRKAAKKARAARLELRVQREALIASGDE